MFELRHCKKRTVAKVLLVLSVASYLIGGLLVVASYAGVRSLLLHSFPSLGVSTASFFLFWLGGTIPVGVIMYLAGYLLGAAYNVTARWWGGLRFDLTRVEEDAFIELQPEHDDQKETIMEPQQEKLPTRRVMRLSKKPAHTNGEDETSEE